MNKVLLSSSNWVKLSQPKGLPLQSPSFGKRRGKDNIPELWDEQMQGLVQRVLGAVSWLLGTVLCHTLLCLGSV